MSTYDYIKYPEDRLYLRVGNLLRELMYYNSKVSNLEGYSYLSTIQRQNKPESPVEDIKKIEQHLTSPNFLNQKCFRDKDREEIISIIRDYKLNQLV